MFEGYFKGLIKNVCISGIGSLGLPPIDPLVIPEIHIGEGQSAVSLVQNYFDAKLLGLSKANISGVK